MYDLLVCKIENDKSNTLKYGFEDANSLIEGMTTIGYTFLKEHLRNKDGVRMTFEILNNEEVKRESTDPPDRTDPAGE